MFVPGRTPELVLPRMWRGGLRALGGRKLSGPRRAGGGPLTRITPSSLRDGLGVRYGPSGVPGVSGGCGGNGIIKAHGFLFEIHTHRGTPTGSGAGGGGGGSSSANAAGEPIRPPMAAAVANAVKRRRMRLMANSNL